jgi:hypothetical protein
MKTYCPECGTKIENFCTNCGYAFAGTKAPQPSYKDHLETIEEEPSQVPQLNGLDYDLDFVTEKEKGFAFGDVVGTAPPPAEGDFPVEESQASSEEFLANFLKEAGTSRPNGPRASDNDSD